MKLNRKNIVWLAIGGFILYLVIYWFKYTGQQLLASLTPVFIGVVIAYPLGIMIEFFKKHDLLYRRGILKSEKLHEALCTAVAIIFMAGCAVFVLGYLGPQLTASVIIVLDKVPAGIRALLKLPFLAKLIPAETMETLQQFDWTNWINHLVSLVSSDELFRNMTTTASSALSAVSNTLFGILFACYFLGGRKQIASVAKRMVRAFVPKRYWTEIFHDGKLLNECFHSFIVCQAVQALMIGVSATLLMYIFGFPYASMIGSLNGFCALIPVIGGYVGAIVGTLMILTDAPSMALFFLIFIVVLQNVIGTLIFPRLLGRSLGTPSVWTLAAVLVGSGLGGIMGILIAVPLTAFGYRLAKEKLEAREALAEERAPASRDA